jgi:hypothetical protein
LEDNAADNLDAKPKRSMTTAKTVTLIISALAVLVGQQISAGTMETPTEQPQAKARFPQTESSLFPHQIGAGQCQTAGLNEEHRQGTVMATHALKIKGLPHGPLGLVGAKTLDEGRPEMVDGRQGRKIKLSVGHQTGNSAIASAIICGDTAMVSRGSALSR